jgi:hypothetical protein
LAHFTPERDDKTKSSHLEKQMQDAARGVEGSNGRKREIMTVKARRNKCTQKERRMEYMNHIVACLSRSNSRSGRGKVQRTFPQRLHGNAEHPFGPPLSAKQKTALVAVHLRFCSTTWNDIPLYLSSQNTLEAQQNECVCVCARVCLRRKRKVLFHFLLKGVNSSVVAFSILKDA